MKKFLLFGNIPLLAVLLVCGASFYAGVTYQEMTTPIQKYVVADKGAIVLNAMLSQPNMNHAEIKSKLQLPILRVMNKYIKQGYVVIDTKKNDDGYSIAAIPENSIDITNEMRNEVDAAMKTGEAKK